MQGVARRNASDEGPFRAVVVWISSLGFLSCLGISCFVIEDQAVADEEESLLSLRQNRQVYPRLVVAVEKSYRPDGSLNSRSTSSDSILCPELSPVSS